MTDIYTNTLDNPTQIQVASCDVGIVVAITPQGNKDLERGAVGIEGSWVLLSIEEAEKLEELLARVIKAQRER